MKAAGHPVRLTPWRHVARRWPNARLWLVGAGANQSELNRQIDAAGLVGRVVIPGVFADVSELLAAADAAVIGGNSGESHTLLLEAMAAGLPIAVNDTPLHRSVVGDESCVHLVPELDSDGLGEILVRTACLVDIVKRSHEDLAQSVAIQFGNQVNARLITNDASVQRGIVHCNGQPRCHRFQQERVGLAAVAADHGRIGCNSGESHTLLLEAMAAGAAHCSERYPFAPKRRW